MNTSTNYSGFIDLLGDIASEKHTCADQYNDPLQEPVVEGTVEKTHSSFDAKTE